MSHDDEPAARNVRRSAGLQGMWRLLIACGMAAMLAIALVLCASVTASRAEAASWHTLKKASGHAESRTYGPVTMYGGRETRLKYWTAKKWDADDAEWEYDWVKFKLVRSDTGKTVKVFGPYYSPTGYQDWRIATITLPSGGHPYKLRVTCDDARWGFKLQQGVPERDPLPARSRYRLVFSRR